MSQNTRPTLRVFIDSTSEGIVLKTAPAPSMLVRSIDPKTRDSGNLERKVGLQKLFYALPPLVIHDVVDKCLHLGMVLSGQIDPPDIPVNPNHWGQAC